MIKLRDKYIDISMRLLAFWIENQFITIAKREL
jgi:hypothetical protein